MKITYSFKDTEEEKKRSKREGFDEKSQSNALQEQNIEKINVGHNNSEMYLRFEETTVLMPPSAVKILTEKLREEVDKYEKEHGKIKLPKKEKDKFSAQNVVKSLYKTKKLSPKLVSINTKKKKKPPFK